MNMPFVRPAPIVPERMSIRPLTREQLLSKSKGPLCVMNTASRVIGSASELFFTVQVPGSNEPQPITLVSSWLPFDLSTVAPRAAVLRSRWFNHALDRNLIVAISEESAAQILSQPGAAAELRRLAEKRNAVREAIRAQREDKTAATILFGNGTANPTKEILDNATSNAQRGQVDGGHAFDFAVSEERAVESQDYIANDNDVPVYNPARSATVDDFSTLDPIPEVAVPSPQVDSFFQVWADGLKGMTTKEAVDAIRKIGTFTLPQIKKIREVCGDAHPNVATWASNKIKALEDV